MSNYKCSIKIVKNRKFLHLRFSYKRERSFICTKKQITFLNIDSFQKELDEISIDFSKFLYKDVEEFKKYFQDNYLENLILKCKAKENFFSNFHTLNSIYNETKKRAKIKNIDFDFSLEDLRNLYLSQNKKCAITQYKLSLNKKNLYKLSIDRINNDLGYIKGNIQLICLGINYLKNTFDNNEVLFFLKNIKLNY